MEIFSNNIIIPTSQYIFIHYTTINIINIPDIDLCSYIVVYSNYVKNKVQLYIDSLEKINLRKRLRNRRILFNDKKIDIKILNYVYDSNYIIKLNYFNNYIIYNNTNNINIIVLSNNNECSKNCNKYCCGTPMKINKNEDDNTLKLFLIDIKNTDNLNNIINLCIINNYIILIHKHEISVEIFGNEYPFYLDNFKISLDINFNPIIYINEEYIKKFINIKLL